MSQSPNFPDCFYRVTVKGLCIRDNKILLAKESDELSGRWELPGGGLDFGESPHETLIREVKEELNLEVTCMSHQPMFVWPVYFPRQNTKGWFYSLVLIYKMELAEYAFTPSLECEEIGWFLKADLSNLNLHAQTAPLAEFLSENDF